MALLTDIQEVRLVVLYHHYHNDVFSHKEAFEVLKKYFPKITQQSENDTVRRLFHKDILEGVNPWKKKRWEKRYPNEILIFHFTEKYERTCKILYLHHWDDINSAIGMQS